MFAIVLTIAIIVLLQMAVFLPTEFVHTYTPVACYYIPSRLELLKQRYALFVQYVIQHALVFRLPEEIRCTGAGDVFIFFFQLHTKQLGRP